MADLPESATPSFGVGIDDQIRAEIRSMLSWAVRARSA